MTDYESRAANERAHNKHVAESAAALSSEDVARFAPAVPAFEFAFEIYYRYLDRRMPNRKLDEYVLARQARSPRSLRLLSLGCGTGDWEIDVARRSGGRLAVTLADLTPELLEKAADAGRREDLNVETKVCDVNEILLPERAFDFIVCRSSLHHFLKLEHVFDQINRGLTAEGRFLVLGEWVGRNGLQYYPQAERIIQAIFQALPDRLRLNRYTNETDSRIPSIDFGANSFEAIRSQEIVGLLMERFDPVEHVLYDGIVTPLLDFRYGPNYDLTNELDRTLIEAITRLDIELIDSGLLKPTAMFGIFAPRRRSWWRRFLPGRRRACEPSDV